MWWGVGASRRSRRASGVCSRPVRMGAAAGHTLRPPAPPENPHTAHTHTRHTHTNTAHTHTTHTRHTAHARTRDALALRAVALFELAVQAVAREREHALDDARVGDLADQLWRQLDFRPKARRAQRQRLFRLWKEGRRGGGVCAPAAVGGPASCVEPRVASVCARACHMPSTPIRATDTHHVTRASQTPVSRSCAPCDTYAHAHDQTAHCTTRAAPASRTPGSRSCS